MSQAVLDAIKAKFGDAVLETSTTYGDESATVTVAKYLEVATFLRDDEKMDFDVPVFLTCIDRLGLPVEGARFEVAVQLRSLSKGHRIRLKAPLEEDKLKIPSLAGLWVAFDWLERETYDMYGVEFEKHPDLRRIYLYDEFVGFPLRKDYPKDRRHPLVRREWSDE